MNFQLLEAQIRQLTLSVAATEVRFKGTQDYFLSEAVINNHEGMERYRQELHALTDQMCDNRATIAMLMRQLAEMRGH